jgi:hypothetical protein
MRATVPAEYVGVPGVATIAHLNVKYLGHANLQVVPFDWPEQLTGVRGRGRGGVLRGAR